MIRNIAAVFLILSTGLSSFAQDMKTLQQSFLEAEYFFLTEDYPEALPLYLSLYQQMPQSANLAYRIGVCYLNISDSKQNALAYLEAASKKVSLRHRDGKLSEYSAPYNAIYQLGVAYRINSQLDKARDSFRKYKETLLKKDEINRAFIDHEIETCNNAKELMEKPVDFEAFNLGVPVNDEKDNFNPIISGDGGTMVFMTSLPFYNAVMFSKLSEGKWSYPVNITPDLKADGDIFVSGLSNDGRILIFSVDDDFNSNLMMSTFNGNVWSKGVPLNSNINTDYWESHGSLSDDGNTLVFASDRPGGLGGLDIYFSEWMNGEWGPAVNAGKEINSFLNEDRPFLINRGKTLFFASQNHRSMGGYDLFRAEATQDGSWGNVQNMGYPFNSTDDNVFFMPLNDGRSGFVSMYREKEGKGKQDIYRIIFK